MQVLPKGTHWIPGHFGIDDQRKLVSEIREVVANAPLFVPRMPRSGRPMTVRMSNCGDLGWVTDKERGYRYQETHPMTGRPWPPMPTMLIDLWNEVSGCPHPPQACLINFYEPKAKMGMHQDKDESDFSAPVVSVSLGDACLFRVGGTNRGDKTSSFRLESGDVVVLSGESRLAFHGVDRIYPDTSALLKQAGRINLTLRRVTV